MRKEYTITHDLNMGITRAVTLVPTDLAAHMFEAFLANQRLVEAHALIENFLSQVREVQFQEHALSKALVLAEEFVEMNTLLNTYLSNPVFADYTVFDHKDIKHSLKFLDNDEP